MTVQPSDAFSNREEMQKFLADAKKLISEAPTQAEELRLTKQLAEQLRAGLDRIQAAQVEQNKYVADGPESEVTRKYFRPQLGQDDARRLGGVCDLREATSRAQGVQERRNRYAGGANGVVRMIGGIERGHWEHGLLDDPRPYCRWQEELQEKVQAAAWCKAIKGTVAPHLMQAIVEHLRSGPQHVAKVFADNAGEGGEWIVTLPMAQLERTLESERMLEATLPSMPVNSSSVTLPFLTTGVQAFVHGVPTSGDNNPAQLPKSVPSTSDRTLSVKTLTVNVPVDMDAAEDSIVDAVPLMNQLVGEAIRDATEDAIINGDTAATHGDTGFATWNPRSRWSTLGSSADHRKAWMGWRQRALDVDATHTDAAEDGSASQTVATYIGSKAKLTVPHGTDDVIYVTSPEHYLAKILIDSNVLTVDKYGAGATILGHEVAKIGTSPLILSDFMTADLNASGLYDGSTTDYTGLVVVNRKRFPMLRRRGMRVNVESVYRENTHYFVASERKGMATIDASTVKNVHYRYKLAKS